MHAHHETIITVAQYNSATCVFPKLSFTLLEIVGGLLTNSVAILSDALHDLGDSLSLGLSWFLQRYSDEGQRHTIFLRVSAVFAAGCGD